MPTRHRSFLLACPFLAFACVDPVAGEAWEPDDASHEPILAAAADVARWTCTPPEQETVWNLAEAPYSMDPDDAGPAVAEAIDDAKDWFEGCPNGSLVLLFPEGEWQFVHPDAPAIELESFTGRLTLRGKGMNDTSLVFTQFDQEGVALADAHGVTIEKMHLTRDGIFTTQGTVVGVSPGHIRFTVHDGFPDPIELANAPNALDNHRTLIRFTGPADDPRLAPNSVAYHLCPDGSTTCPNAITVNDSGVYKAHLEDPTLVPDLEPGDFVALKAKVGANTVRAIDSDELTVSRVRFTRNSAVSLVVGGRSDQTVVEHVKVERSGPIHGRVPFFAGPGGGPQITADTIGPIIRHCEITGTTDDAIAVFSTPEDPESALYGDPQTLMSGAIIEHNTIRDTHGRGINITQSRNGLCQNNRLIRGQNPSIQLKNNQTADLTSLAVINWTIKDNVIEQPWTYPAIFLTEEGSNTQSGLIRGITIEGNRFIEASRNNPLIQVSHTKDVTIASNRVESFSNADDFADDDVPDPVPLVYVQAAKTVSGDENACLADTDRPAVTVDDPGAVVTMTWSFE